MENNFKVLQTGRRNKLPAAGQRRRQIHHSGKKNSQGLEGFSLLLKRLELSSAHHHRPLSSMSSGEGVLSADLKSEIFSQSPLTKNK